MVAYIRGYRNMHDIVALTRSKDHAERLANDYPWIATVVGFEVTEALMREILSKVSTRFFYVAYPDPTALDRLDDLLTEIEDHEHQYVHTWNNTLLVRLYHKKTVEADPVAYTDAAITSTDGRIKDHTDPTLRHTPWTVYATIEEGLEQTDREYVLVADPKAIVVDLPTTAYPTSWNATKEHRWTRTDPMDNIVGPGAILYPTFVNDPVILETGLPSLRDPSFPLLYVDSLDRVELGGTFGSEMTYIADERFTFTTPIDTLPYPPLYDRDKIHVWRATSGHEVLKLVPKDYADAPVKEMPEAIASFPALPITTAPTETPSWVLTDGFEIAPTFDLRLHYSTDPAEWKTNEPWSRDTAYHFTTVDRHGKTLDTSHLRLCSTGTSEVRYSHRIGAVLKEFEIIFLSYNEPLADENYARLVARFPRAKRVHGVRGFFEAHKAAANIAESLMFYVVDADAVIVDDFAFDYMPDEYDYGVTHVWRSKNPINNLEYGYGGVKLFPTKALQDATSWNIDFTTSVGSGFKIIPSVSNITRFNTDRFNTWKSAFRECAKLSAGIIKNQNNEETELRLKTWKTISNCMEPFADVCIRGALEGEAYGSMFRDDAIALNRINDFEWLYKQFERSEEANEKD